MINKKLLIAAVLAMSVSINTGCANVDKPAAPGGTNITEPDKSQNGSGFDEARQESIMKEYETIIAKENNISEYIFFADKNISALSPENASKLIIKLEGIQKDYLPNLEDKYYTTGNIQSTLEELYKPEYDLSSIDAADVKDEEVKKVLEETIKLGYKIETAEGMFFPIIDYSFYEKYSSYAAVDIKDYITLMTAESDKVPAKDAALVISWDELFDRAFKQEKFLSQHKNSAKYEEVKDLYKKYVTFAVYGLNNTPLFAYENKKMNADAKAAYEKAVAQDSNLAQVLKAYYEAIKKDGFKLTDKVKSYQGDLIKNEKFLP